MSPGMPYPARNYLLVQKWVTVTVAWEKVVILNSDCLTNLVTLRRG
jgi:hypothetical protein